MNNKEKAYKRITYSQLKEIMLDGIQYFPEIVKNVFCSNCLMTEIVDYTINLSGTGCVVLKGTCKKCGKPVARVLETNEESAGGKKGETNL